MDKISFYEQVYQVVALIPKGKVTSYGAIAAYLGTRGSSRLVGYAMNQVHSLSLKRTKADTNSTNVHEYI